MKGFEPLDEEIRSWNLGRRINSALLIAKITTVEKLRETFARGDERWLNGIGARSIQVLRGKLQMPPTKSTYVENIERLAAEKIKLQETVERIAVALEKIAESLK